MAITPMESGLPAACFREQITKKIDALLPRLNRGDRETNDSMRRVEEVLNRVRAPGFWSAQGGHSKALYSLFENLKTEIESERGLLRSVPRPAEGAGALRDSAGLAITDTDRSSSTQFITGAEELLEFMGMPVWTPDFKGNAGEVMGQLKHAFNNKQLRVNDYFWYNGVLRQLKQRP